MAVRNCADIGENLKKIMERLLDNDDLVKLLYYTDKDPLSASNPALTSDQKKTEIFEKLIKIVPRVGAKETAKQVLAIRLDNATRLEDNKEFKRVYLTIEIFTPLNQWIIKDVNLRPFKTAGEIQNSLDGKRINGIGTMNFSGITLDFLTDEISCYAMKFDLTSYD